MQGDFSRVTFDPVHRFSAVLSQQGRVQLDSEINEQTAILLHYLRGLVTDVLGPAACPVAGEEDPGGFRVDFTDGVLKVSPGHMYVDGMLCECDGAEYWSQPDGHLDQNHDESRKLPADPFMVYLRVWERLVTAHEEPSIRELALGLHGPDTTLRTRVVWQLDWVSLGPGGLEVFPEADNALTALKEGLDRRFGARGMLAARAQLPEDETDPCDLSPESGFRGPENQLYRVEVHRGGTAGQATFKWSRENGSVVFPVRSAAGATFELDTLGRDDKLGLDLGDVVEVVDDASVARAAWDVVPRDATRLYRIVEIDHAARRVTLDNDPAFDPHQLGLGTAPGLRPLLRRWDHRPPESAEHSGALPVEEGRWLTLEDGVQVRFEPAPPPAGVPGGEDAEDAEPVRRVYRPGDYWLIPARVVTGDVLWPEDAQGKREPRMPHGVEYHYAPLAKVEPAGDADRTVIDLRSLFVPLAKARA
ncbi:DUF4815 domain-containing protein [Streptomyces cinnabarinus]|uniref:DUF4815 domain-containing protein n=1 Tax=Streptomyces cinnabarinus TaxID=67287 RepID=A0ABY7K9N2_9ACTN|nr:DUF6519 domain-containing protein [Streptomyces cinnabarinus]WAZ20022.1 DUF4815 domain-containing protein [Streptomyces cinnabarinus]